MIFSVIIPCYNCQDTIKRTINSVLNQTFKDFEIIFVDDGSSDSTKSIIFDSLESKEVSFKYFFQENMGPSYARNKAVSNARGKYLAFLDSDDSWHEENLAFLYSLILKYNIRFIASKYTFDDYKILSETNIVKYNFNDFILKNRTSTPCTILEKELFYEVGGFNAQMSYSEDYNLWLKVSLKEPLYLYEGKLVKLHKKAYGEDGLSSNLWEMEKGELYNYNYFYKNKNINFFKYIFLVAFSLLKYVRRKVLS